MEFFWFLVTPILIILAVLTIVDVIRRQNGGWSMAGWILLIVILPGIGSLIYWATRKTSSHDAEQAYLNEQDRRQQAAHKPIDGGF